jgi:hypothetical protein
LTSCPHSLRPSHQRSYAELVRNDTKIPIAPPTTATGNPGNITADRSSQRSASTTAVDATTYSSTARHCQASSPITEPL